MRTWVLRHTSFASEDSDLILTARSFDGSAPVPCQRLCCSVATGDSGGLLVLMSNAFEKHGMQL